MADFNAIKDVSETLEQVLSAGLAPIGATCVVHDLLNNMPPPAMTLTLTLYEAVEDPNARNRPNERLMQGNKIIVRRPPAALLLRYLVTPWGGTPKTDHQILGRAIQVLYDNAVISGAALQGTLVSSNEAIQLAMIPLTLEDRSHVWRAIEKKYHLSANYEVRVVEIETTKQQEIQPIKSRRLDFGDPEVTP